MEGESLLKDGNKERGRGAETEEVWMIKMKNKTHTWLASVVQKQLALSYPLHLGGYEIKELEQKRGKKSCSM